jgi:ribosome maturation factor RimP
MEMILKKISEMADSIAAGFGVQIVDLKLVGSPRRQILRVFIDKENGVTLDDCEKFSRAFSALLDVEDIIQTTYVLEVSSPGLDRPLKDINDFVRSKGKLVKITTSEKIGNQNLFTGRVLEVEDDNIRLSIDKHTEIYVPLARILKARLEIEIK